MILRRLAHWLSVSFLAALACSANDSTVPGDVEASGGSGGNMQCSAAGFGTLNIEVTGLPADVAPEIQLAGPGALGIAEPGLYQDLPAGLYAVTALRVSDFDPIVRTVYAPTTASASGCLVDGTELTISVEYAAIPSSNKLWLASGGADELVGFGSADLSESAAFDSTVAIDGPAGTDVAFDPDGNLWSLGPTVADPLLVRFDAASLGESGTLEPSVTMNVPQIACVEALRSLAFDAEGNLWLSACDNQVVRVEANALGLADADADVVFSGFTDNQGIAFDSAGNLWVADDGLLTRYDADRLGASDSETADLILSVNDVAETQTLVAHKLAFDQAGNLWATDFVDNTVFMVNAATLELSGVDIVVADVSIAIAVTLTAQGLAFDESNALWITLDSERFGKLTAEQLGESSSPDVPTMPEVVIQSSSVGDAGGLAFFPAPAGLPLYHALP
jgi:sugar lactone lactonase YvrE